MQITHGLSQEYSVVDNTYDLTSPTPIASYDIANTNNFAPISEEQASKTALNVQYGMDKFWDKPFDEIKYNLQAGQEQLLRQEAATTIDAQKQTDLQGVIKDKLSTIVDPQLQLKTVQDAVNNVKPTDPSSVFEDTLAQRYTSDVYNLNLGGTRYQWLQDAMQYMPKGVQAAVDLANKNTSRFFFSKKMEEEAQNKYESSGWGEWAGQTLLQNVAQVYPEYVMRGQVQGSSFWKGLLGTNLEEQRKALYSLPNDSDFRTEYQRIMNHYYGNGMYDIARQFSKAMSGFSQDDQLLQNLFTPLAPFDIAAGLKASTNLLKLRTSTVDMAKNLTKGAEGFTTQPPKVASATGTGDLSEAAVQGTTGKVIQQVTGGTNETQRGLDALTSNLKLFIQEARANPGNYGQEIANRLQDMLDAGNINEAITTWQRANRTPVAVSSEQVVRATKDMLKGQWKGPDNAVINVKDPVHEPLSNTYVYEHIIGTPDGEFFKDAETARGAGKLYDLVTKPSASKALNDINQEIARARKAGEDVSGIQGRRDAFVANNKDTLANKGAARGVDGYEIKNDDSGAGYYISYTKHLKETDDGIRDTLLTRNQFTQPISVKEYMDNIRAGNIDTSIPSSRGGDWFNAVFGRIRTPVDTLPKEEIAARNLTTFGPGRLKRLAESIGEPIKAMPKKYQAEFERFLIQGQYKTDPVSGLPGYRFKSPADIEAHYQQYFKRLPDISEIEAYYSYVKLNEFDRMVRETLNFRNKAINGVEQHQFSLLGTDGKTKIKSGFVEAIRQNKLPGGHDSIAFLGNRLGDETWALGDRLGNSMSMKALSKVKDQLEKGEMYVLRIWNPEEFPLRHLGGTFADKRVRYIVLPSYETKPLGWNTIPSRGGGHLVPDYQFYLKQANIFREVIRKGKTVLGIHDWYHGDRTIMPIDIAAKGEAVAKGMNEVREALRGGDEARARQLHIQHQLPFDVDDHLGWYKEKHDPSGTKLDPRLNLDHEIRVVPRDKNIADLDSSLRDKFDYTNRFGNIENSFRDGTTSGSDARLAQIEFTGKRDAHELYTVGDGGPGTMRNPLFSWEQGKYVDPITTMNRGLGRIVNSAFMDDYKLYAMEHTLQQWRPYISQSFLDKMKAAPWAVFSQLDEGSGVFRAGVPADIRSILLSNLKKTKDFVGVTSKTDALLNSGAQKMADSIWTRTGKSALAVVPMNALPYVKDPIRFIRSVAVNFHLGLGNLSAFATQFTTIGNVAFISPRHAISGALGMTLHAFASVNRSEQVMNFLDKMASTFGTTGRAVQFGTDIAQVMFKPGQWLESTKILDRVGFAHVGGEHGFINTPINVNLVKSLGEQALSMGMKPFEWGASSTRVAGWHTAYLEYREANPTGTIGRKEISDILSRATVLDHNMNKGATSSLQTGVFSPFSLFYGYSMRLTEMMFGKQLTPMEKFRLISGNALMYGAPVGAGGFAAFPIADKIRTNMLRTGNPIGSEKLEEAGYTKPYVPGENPYTTIAMEGLPSYVTAWILGDTKNTKNYYNFSRYGNKGIDALNLSADRAWWESVVLASDAKNIARTASPFVDWVSSLWAKEGGAFTPTLQDVWNVGTVASEGNKISQTIKAFNTMDWAQKTGKWYTRSESYVGDVSPAEAIMFHLSGLEKQDFQDIYLKGGYVKQQAAIEKQAERDFTIYYRRGLDNNDAGNKDEALRNFTNANAILVRSNYPSQKLGQLFTRASDGYESMLDRMDFDFYVRSARPNEIDALNQALKQRGK